MRKLRSIYALMFIVLHCVEICIALFAHDDFVRPYIGDVLVTVLLCCLCRIVIPKGVPVLPIYVFAFAALVEMAQYVDVVKWLGWENNALLSTLIGRTFSWADILCYGIGCLVFWVAEKIGRSCWRIAAVR